MKIGFVGAGKVCYTLSYYLNNKYHNVCGIYSKNVDDAKDASLFSISEYYSNLSSLLDFCDTLFLTVNDDSIKDVVAELIKLDVKGKTLIHTSGSYTSDIFMSLLDNNYCYSLHPIYAFNDKYNSIKNFDEAYFTIEGNNIDNISKIKELFLNKVIDIKKEDKIKYHLSCVMLSNFICAITYKAEEILNEIGIDNINIFKPLILNNINNILNYGSINSLTGPVIRNDISTIKKHLEVLDDSKMYVELSKILIDVAKKRNNLDYSELNNLLNNGGNND